MKSFSNTVWVRGVSCLLLALSGFVAQAQRPPAIEIEASIETVGANTHFPRSPDGRVSVSGCAQCRDQSLSLTAATRYTINGAAVTLAQITSAAAGAQHSVTIHFALSDRLVSRIDLVTQ
jgi:hypothetical protein